MDFEASVEQGTLAERLQAALSGMPGLARRRGVLLGAALCIAVAAPVAAGADGASPSSGDVAMELATLRARLSVLEQRVAPPELGRQMLELQLRHDRLWWAGEAGSWNLAYYMTGELGEALRGIEESNGDAPELQPEKLSQVMPSIMNPAVRGVQQALEKRNEAAFGRAFDQLSAACNACHAKAGVAFLHIQRPKTPLLDNLRYAPAKGK